MTGRAGAALAAVAAGWLLRFALPARTSSFYYAVSFAPFLCLALALCLGLILGPTDASLARQVVGAAIATAYLAVVGVNFLYPYPGSPEARSPTPPG